ncbi:MAG: 30S ribosome-binding factor RbfA [Alphaproteobacteria bacterium]|jgi:ribosome-binding factor A
MTRQHSGKAPSQRQLRVGEIIRHALAEVFSRVDIDDPVLKKQFITVSEVKASPDLRHATVFIWPLGGDDPKAVASALKRHQRFLRGELARRVELKYMPELVFQLDNSYDEAERIDTLLRSTHTPPASEQ